MHASDVCSYIDLNHAEGEENAHLKDLTRSVIGLISGWILTTSFSSFIGLCIYALKTGINVQY